MINKPKTKSIMDMVFWRITYLMTLIQLSRVGAQFVDSFVMSRFFGSTAIAAAGLVNPFFTVTSLLAGLISTGCQSLCSQSLGAGNKEKANTAFSTSMGLGFTVSLLLGAATFLFAVPICAFLGARGNSADILPDAVIYLRMLALGTPGLIVNYIFAPIVQLDGGRRSLNIATLIIFGGDVVFDLLAVAWGWGFMGIGIATTVSTYLGTLIYILFFLKSRTMLHFSVRSINLEMAWSMVRKGGPDAFKRLYKVLRDFLNNYFVLLLGAGVAMAGKSVGDSLINFLTCFGVGTSYSVYLLSGIYIGEKKRRGMELLIRRGIMNVFITACLSITAIVFAPLLLDIFLPALDPSMRNEAIVCVRAMLTQMPFYVGFEMFTSYLQSIGKNKDANVISFCGIVIFYIPAMLLLGFTNGAAGTIISIPLGFLLSFVAYYIYVWAKKRRMPTSDDVFYLTEQFGNKEQPEIDMTIRSKKDMAECVRSVLEMMLKEGISEKSANRAALMIEELCSNVITHGFPTVTETLRMVEVRLLIDDDNITVRIQDCCKQFNVSEQYEAIRKELSDPENAPGLKIVHSLADDVKYLSTLDINDVIITLHKE